MMSMSISYEETGRRSQKARTRAALVEAARELLTRGRAPTVEEAATAASVSRATAYRYFANQQALLVAAHPEVETASLLGTDAPSDPEERLDLVVTALARIFLDAEPSYRTMLRLSLETGTDRGELALRKGRRYLWIRDALAPLRDRLPRAELDRLVHAVAVTIGIEALVTLVDLAGLSRRRAVGVMRWSARAQLRSALAESAKPTR
ncbi:MAG TPA: helix-turn-helix domain-containing protein [Thermoanaerobaculia bacterium]|nr:helix-turn-helix domain-containing protein [Thermoanaerobaculia bacterium]